ncbi:MAG: septum formation protein Maf [Desulfovibrionales bacterium GWA2_65_9]|nr:MAG: septum formation protein Maf [Desulfovibrionales bacterium GWA2_65_9]
MTNAYLSDAPLGAFRTLSALVLASNSPRRRDLLGSLGLELEICPSNAPEPPPLPLEEPEAYAKRMACLKTLDVAVLYPDCAVLGADTIVVLPAEAGAGAQILGRPPQILGKPVDETDALRMLTLLSGRAHQVITGCCLALPGQENPISFAEVTEVVMRASRQEELRAYIATGEPADKAGAYAIQGLGAFLVERVMGSYTNVVGLPVAECARHLLDTGLIAAR